MCKIVIVDERDDILTQFRNDIATLFPSHSVYSFKSTRDTIYEFKQLDHIDILFFNSLLNHSSEITGLEFAAHVREHSPHTIMFYIEEKGIVDTDHMLNLSKVGIDGFINYPYSPVMLKIFITNAISRLQSFNKIKTPDYLALIESIELYVAGWDSVLKYINKPKIPHRGNLSIWMKFMTKLKQILNIQKSIRN